METVATPYKDPIAMNGDEEEAASNPAQRGLSDEQILTMIDAEKQASIGFENGEDLERKRRQALEYIKGQMSDVPSLPNRSKAVSTDIDEAVETIMPDLMEIFTGGEDVASFPPVGHEDEDGAKQETEWVNHTAFQKLPGFLLLYTAIKDALQVDTGLIETYWQDNEVTEEEKLEGKSAIEIQMALESGAQLVEEAVPAGEYEGVPLFDVTIQRTYDRGCLKSCAVDPSNLTMAADSTFDWNETIYCAIRSFPRAQALLDQGFDPQKVAQIPGYTHRGTNDETDQARDRAGETTSLAMDTSGHGGPDDQDGKSLLRVVEIHKHFIRADFEGTGKSQLWKVHTDADCKIILDKRKIDRHGIAAGTPFINAHRFYGVSLAEKLVEVQKIKTALWRLLLDSGYFALNQRTEVAMDQASEHTIPDLMDNTPARPVRSRTGTAVRPLTAGSLGFDAPLAIELASVMGEQRTGVVRNAQGLAPDTLHDTASGAKALMTMAQKRVRLIARILAETLVKGWFLDIHAFTRKHATRPEKMRLRGKWVDVDPSNFGSRSDMTIEVGVGSGGKEMELAGLGQLITFQEKLIQSEMPEYAGMATPDNVYATVSRFAERLGFKSPETFFTDPAQIREREQQEAAMRQAQGIPEPEEPPSPEVMKAQAEMELKAKAQQDDMAMRGQEMQAKQQASALELQQKAEQSERQAQREYDLQMAKLAADERARKYQIDQEIQLKASQLNAELEMNREIEAMKIAAGVYAPKSNGVDTSEVHLGGEAGA